MADKTCSQCGSEVPGAASFCTQCGSRDLVEASPSGGAGDEPTTAMTPDSPTVPVSPEAPAPPYQDDTVPRVPEASPPPTATPPPPASPPPSASPPPPEATVMDTPAVDQPTAVWDTPPVAPPSPTPHPGAPMTGPAPAATEAAPSGGGKAGAALGLLGAAAAMVGAFLEWMKITPTGADAVTLSGWTLSDDAKIVLAVGAVAVVATVVVLGGSLRRAMRLVAAVAGIVLVGLGAYDTYDILQELPDALEKVGVTGVEIAAPGIGLILVMAGGAVLLLGALAMTGPKKQAQQAQAPGPVPGQAPAPAPFPGQGQAPAPAPLPGQAPGYPAAPPTQPTPGYAPPQETSWAPQPGESGPYGGQTPPPAPGI